MSFDALNLSAGSIAWTGSWVATGIGLGMWLWSWFGEKNPIQKLRFRDCGVVMLFSGILTRDRGSGPADDRGRLGHGLPRPAVHRRRPVAAGQDGDGAGTMKAALALAGLATCVAGARCRPRRLSGATSKAA